MRQEQQPLEDRMMDVLGSMPPESGQPEHGPHSRRPASVPAEQEVVLGEVAALAHTLVAQLPPESALARALALCPRLLSGVRALRLFAVMGGGAGRLTLVGDVTRVDETHGGGTYASREVEQDAATLGLGDEADGLVLREHKAHRSGSTQALPLESPAGALIGVLVIEDDPRVRREPPMLALCMDTLTALLERLHRERLTARLERALETLPVLVSGAQDAVTELAASRRALQVVTELACATAALLLMPNQGHALHAIGEDGGSLPLDPTRSAEIVRALHGKGCLVMSAESSPDLWISLTALRARLHEMGGAEPSRLTLLAVVDAGEITAVLVLASAAAAGEGREWLPAARAVIAATEAGLRARRLRQQVAAESRARDEYISLTGHELRSPLTSIKGYAQLLARQSRKTTLPESMVRSVEAIEQQSLRMSEMVGELLDASRIQRGRLEVNLVETDLVPIALKVVERRRTFHPRHQIELDIAADSLAGHWDAMRVEQILRDLLDNAARFSPEGGPITIRLAHEGSNAVVRVRDQGIGVGEGDRERIFEYLYRAPEAEQRNLSSLGLGLYICRHVAERMGGRLTLRETRTGTGSGSIFELTLPLA